MKRGFKNALCQASRPDTWTGDSNRCKRKGSHSGPHRIKYKDGKYVFWNDGDKEAQISNGQEAYQHFKAQGLEEK